MAVLGYLAKLKRGEPFRLAVAHEFFRTLFGLREEPIVPDRIIRVGVMHAFVLGEQSKRAAPIIRQFLHPGEYFGIPLFSPSPPLFEPLGFNREKKGEKGMFREPVGGIEINQMFRFDRRFVENSVTPGTDPQPLKRLGSQEMIPQQTMPRIVHQSPGLGVQKLRQGAKTPPFPSRLHFPEPVRRRWGSKQANPGSLGGSPEECPLH